MPRTVVPPARMRGSGGAAGGGDSLPERLVKYVPAETLAFFVPLAAVLDPADRGLVVTILAAGVVGTAGYLWLARTRAAEDERPLPHFYVLACVAFVCWAVGTSGAVAGLLGLTRLAAGVVLGLGVFLIPLADGVLNRVLGR